MVWREVEWGSGGNAEVAETAMQAIWRRLGRRHKLPQEVRFGVLLYRIQLEAMDADALNL